MEMFGIIKFTCSYDEWKSIYDGDIQLRKQFMKDDIIGKVDESTLDEAPDAYKNMYDVMEAQKDSVKIINHIKPIINWKG